MTGESVQITIPFSRLASGAREGTSLYRELREPLLGYLACPGLSKDEPKMLYRTLSSACIGTSPPGALRTTCVAGCFAWLTRHVGKSTLVWKPVIKYISDATTQFARLHQNCATARQQGTFALSYPPYRQPNAGYGYK